MKSVAAFLASDPEGAKSRVVVSYHDLCLSVYSLTTNRFRFTLGIAIIRGYPLVPECWCIREQGFVS